MNININITLPQVLAVQCEPGGGGGACALHYKYDYSHNYLYIIFTMPQVLAVQREPGGGGAYAVGVCNAGEGCDPFHPARAAAPTAEPQRLLCLVARGVPAARVADGAFWSAYTHIHTYVHAFIHTCTRTRTHAHHLCARCVACSASRRPGGASWSVCA
jgi:hypothetical protein